jgi:hypothetical protein
VGGIMKTCKESNKEELFDLLQKIKKQTDEMLTKQFPELAKKTPFDTSITTAFDTMLYLVYSDDSPVDNSIDLQG